MKRMGMVIGIKPERIAEYKKTHAAVWPEVLAKISDCNMRNYTIFLREPENLLFGYFEYHGGDWAADSAKMAADPKTQEWWAIDNPMQTPIDSRDEGDWWAMAEEVFTPTEPEPHASAPARARTRRSLPPQPYFASCPQFDKPKDDGAVTLAGAPHRSHTINHGRLDLDKALIPVALHGPSR